MSSDRAAGTSFKRSRAGASRGALVTATALGALIAVGAGVLAPERAAAGQAAGCSTQATPGAGIGDAGTHQLALPGPPAGVVASSDGSHTYVALSSVDGSSSSSSGGLLGGLLGSPQPSGGVAVLDGQDAGTAVARVVDLPGHPAGVAITHDGQLLLVADGTSVLALSTAALDGAGGPVVLGQLGDGRTGMSQVAITPDDRYAFVSDGGSATVSVFDLAQARADGFGQPAEVDHIVVGGGPAGLALSPDARHLFVASAAAPPGSGVPTGQGALSVIDALAAEQGAAAAPLAVTAAGCAPARVAVSAAGDVAWVTAQGSDALLAFAADSLENGQASPPEAVVDVGSRPTGLALVGDGGSGDDEDTAVVADSGTGTGPEALSVVDTQAALTGGQALLGSVPAGGGPQELALTPGGDTLLAGDATGDTLEAVDTAQLPEGSERSSSATSSQLRVVVQPRLVRAGRAHRFRIQVTARPAPDVSFRPVRGAAISFAGHRLRTSRSGWVSLRLALSGRRARYPVLASHAGFSAGTAAVTVRRSL